jgi:hypothetical protein
MTRLLDVCSSAWNNRGLLGHSRHLIEAPQSNYSFAWVPINIPLTTKREKLPMNTTINALSVEMTVFTQDTWCAQLQADAVISTAMHKVSE